MTLNRSRALERPGDGLARVVPRMVFVPSRSAGPTLLACRHADRRNPHSGTNCRRRCAILAASEQERGKLDLLLSLRLHDALYPSGSLQDLMTELSRTARQRGLTPEVLESILHERGIQGGGIRP